MYIRIVVIPHLDGYYHRIDILVSDNIDRFISKLIT